MALGGHQIPFLKIMDEMATQWPPSYFFLFVDKKGTW
jgi:hypothetical protein